MIIAPRPKSLVGPGAWRSAIPVTLSPVGEAVSELRIHYGPGYRVYFVQRGETLIVLLCGGDKRTQDKDISLALKLAKEV